MAFTVEQEKFIWAAISATLGGLAYGITWEAENRGPFLNIIATSEDIKPIDAIPVGKWVRVAKSTLEISNYGVAPVLADQLRISNRLDELPALLLAIANRGQVNVGFQYGFQHRPFQGVFDKWTPQIALPSPRTIWPVVENGDFPDLYQTFSLSVTLLLYPESISVPAFDPLPPRKPRKFGRSALTRWLEEHAAIKNGKKFARNTKKMIADPNDENLGLGKAGTEEWRDKAWRLSKDAVGRVAKNAIEKAVDVAVQEGGKRVVKSTLKKALNSKLKSLERLANKK